MTFYQSGTGYRCAQEKESADFTHEDVSRLQDYLSELEDTIGRLTSHIAELESAMYTLENETRIHLVAEAETQADAVPGSSGGIAPHDTRPVPRSSCETPILFRFDPRNTRPPITPASNTPAAAPGSDDQYNR